MPSLKLSSLVRRSPDQPTLRERAAALKSRAATVMRRKPMAWPEAGSDEAWAMFKAACVQSDCLDHAAVQGYPELLRAPLEFWTTTTLWKALEAGEMAPAEVAPLYQLAAERELRINASSVRARVGALQALAFAESYPVPGEGEASPEPGARSQADSSAATPALVKLVAEWQALLAECLRVTDDSDHRERALERLSELQARIYAFPSTSLADLQAKLPALRDEFSDIEAGPDPARPYLLRQAADSLLRDIAKFDPEKGPHGEAADRLDLSGCSIEEVCQLYVAFERVNDVLTSALNHPSFTKPSARYPNSCAVDMTPGGTVADREWDRSGWMVDACIQELRRRKPSSASERAGALSTLLIYELRCEGSIQDQGLLAEVVQAWGA